MFKVIGNPAGLASTTHGPAEEKEPALIEANEVKLNIGNISFTSTTEGIYAVLEGKCNVLSVELPPSSRYAGKNRGFALVTVQPISGTVVEMLGSLQSLELDGRKVSVRLRR